MRPIPESDVQPVPGLQPGEIPIGWASEPDQIFTQLPTETGLTISTINLKSGRREFWQALKPKDPVGFRPITYPTAITPEGHWMVFVYNTELGQLYRSDTLR